MSRWVIPNRTGLRGEDVAGTEDNAVSRIVKFIPAEVIGTFTLLFTLLSSMEGSPEYRPEAAGSLILLFLIVTIAYIARKAKKEHKNVQRAHYLVSPIAFLAWAYPISSSSLGDWFVPLVAFALQAIVLALSIFIRPVID